MAEEIERLISDFKKELGSNNLRLKVRKLIPVFHRLRDLGSSLISQSDAHSARDRILAYFTKFPCTVIDGDELMVISGIGEWARRVRELRVQFGWWICSGVTVRELAEDAQAEVTVFGIDAAELKPDQYILMSEEQDRDAAYRWNVLNKLRKKTGSVQSKIIAFLRQNVGKPISGEELRYLANDKKEWARRTRELRTEEGWPIVTNLSGRPDLSVGVYVLEEDRQAPAHDRHIKDNIRVAVLTRDEFRCTGCGWQRSKLRPDDPRKLLELHHKKPHADKGGNTEDNLVTLCNVCHDEEHRRLKTHAHKQ